MVAVWLTAALIAHLADLSLRWTRSPRNWLYESGILYFRTEGRRNETQVDTTGNRQRGPYRRSHRARARDHRSYRERGGAAAARPERSTAAALGFVTDASKVSAAAFPTYKPGQHCGVCAQFQGKPGDATGGCNNSAGHSVPQGGWCKVWAQKPAG